MKPTTCLAFVAAIALGACANNDFSTPPPASAAASPLADYHIADIAVSFAPGAKLEWCEDDLMECGDVETRVTETFKTAAAKGAASMSGPKPARLDVRVTRFDSITLFSRYTSGGIHDIDADYALSDLETGAPLATRDDLDFDRIAWGRAAALIARLAGRTQRVRISERIARVTDEWIRYESGQPAVAIAAAPCVGGDCVAVAARME